MMRRGGLVLAGGLMVGILGPACAPSETEPVVTVTPAEPHINDTDGTTTVTISVLDELARKGTGVVRVTTKVGLFGDQGNNTLVTLSDGSASVPFTCPVAKDPNCAQGVSSISADWRGNLATGKVYVGERGKQLMESKTGTTVPPPVPSVDPTESGTFDVFSTAQVYFIGSLDAEVSTPRAASSVLQPLKHFVGFPATASGTILPKIRPDGRLVYLSAETSSKVYLARGDEFTQSPTTGHTVYPGDSIANDELVSTPKCGTAGVADFMVHPTTNDIYYSCSGGNGAYYSPAGTVVVPADTYTLRKLGNGGYKLVGERASSGQRLFLLDGNNTAKMVSLASNPDTSYMLVSSARAKTDGFHMVYVFGATRQLWRLSYSGIWSRVGVFASTLPTGYSLAASHNWVLDAQGNAYAEVISDTGVEAIARFPLNGTTATIVYTESSRPADAGFAQWPPKLFNSLNRSFLLTGP